MGADNVNYALSVTKIIVRKLYLEMFVLIEEGVELISARQPESRRLTGYKLMCKKSPTANVDEYPFEDLGVFSLK
jgi:hypothetical protein